MFRRSTTSSPAGASAAGASNANRDGELVARCVLGDGSAWRALYERHAPAVFRFIGALGVPLDEREDAAQDVFVAVYRSLPQFRGEAQLSTWIYRIAARHAGRLARRRRMRDMLARVVSGEPSFVEPLPDPSERAAHILFLERLLARLAPKKRAVLVLFEIEGVPVEEIATIVGCPVNTVWSRLHHARAELLKLAQKSTLRPGKKEPPAAQEGEG